MEFVNDLKLFYIVTDITCIALTQKPFEKLTLSKCSDDRLH